MTNGLKLLEQKKQDDQPKSIYIYQKEEEKPNSMVRSGFDP